MMSDCCNCELLYIVAGFGNRINIYNKKEIDKIPKGKTYYFECGKCDQPCDVKENKY